MPASWSRFSLSLALVAFSATLIARPHPFSHGSGWKELSIGPFSVDTQGDIDQARHELTQMEQVRWVLGGLLETQDLESTWPIRVVFTKEEVPPQNGFELQNGQYLLVCRQGTQVPLGALAGIFLDANTPRLPAEVESGLRELFSTLQAHGSRVTWGGAPAHPDLAWARMQLFATSFDYRATFHIFLASLKSGSTMRAAETNAFAKPQADLEREAKANLASHNWQPVSVSGRPLNPKRDLGEQPMAPELAAVYIADAQLRSKPNFAEGTFKSVLSAGGTTAALGYEGLAQVAELEKRDPLPFLEKAIAAGSRSAPVYVAVAQTAPPARAFALLKTASQLNPRWAKPLAVEAGLTADLHRREKLLTKAVELDPRATGYWIELAKAETANGEATAAEGSWLRAEQSAPTQAKAAHIHQMQAASEQQRLNDEEAAARRAQNAAVEADEQAQDAQMARIQAAEKAANQAVTDAEGDAPPEKAVPWNAAFPHKKLAGTLTVVDCLHTATRLSVKRRNGETVRLLLRNRPPDGLVCGPQRPTRQVSIVYAVEPDHSFRTAGTVVSLRLR
ncbi:MAG TPA: hypothetical protein VF283_15110 [Bryobacteraceae bacterium]